MRESFWIIGLLDYLNCTFGALCLTGSADQAFAWFARDWLAVFNLVDADWASVDTSFAASAFRIDNNLYHFCLTSLYYFLQMLLCKIKGFRLFTVFFHVILTRFHWWLIQPYLGLSDSRRCFSCMFQGKSLLWFGMFRVFWGLFQPGLSPLQLDLVA